MAENENNSGHTTGKEFPEQAELTANLTAMIQKVNASDLSGEEKKKAIANLSGVTRKEMTAIIDTTGPKLNESIRAIIAAKRE